MNLTDGIKGSATACYVVWRPRTSGVNQREGLQPTPAPSHFARVIEGLLGRHNRSMGGVPVWVNCPNNSDLSPSSTFFHVPVLDEVFAESRLGNPDEPVSVEKHKKHNRPMGHLKPSEGRDLVAWKSFCQSVPNTPMKVGESWATIGRAAKLPNGSMRVFHGAGTTEEENAGQRSYTDERERPSKRFGLMQGSRRVTSRSGGGYGLWPATALQQTSPHYRRNLNPCAEKVRPHRARSLFSL